MSHDDVSAITTAYRGECAVMKFIELFAGIGGFRAGLEPLGHMCVGWVEWDKYARKSYEAIWPSAKEEWTANDITTVTDDALREFAGSVGGIDLIAGGFPCQAFSVAGKRGGFEDTRGTLFFEVARFANVLRPKYLLLENVVGLLNHDDGRTFYTILNVLEELGYWYEWQVCNATDFGIPQNRERVFIVGHLGGTGGRKVFPILQTDREVAAEPRCVGMLDMPGRHEIARRVYDISGSSPTIHTMQGGGLEPKVLQRPRGNNSGGLHELAPTVTSNSYQDNNHVMVIQKTHGATTTVNYDQTGTLQASRLDKIPCIPVVKNDGQWSEREIAQNIDANYHKGIDNHGARTAIATGARIRKLTPRECWRLMGRTDEEFDKAKYLTKHEAEIYISKLRNKGKRDIPDSTRIERLSDSQLYKQAGNSLVPQIVTEIGKRMEV